MKHCTRLVYFDQRLGAAHAKRWSKWSFSAFLLQKKQKKQEICSKFQQKRLFFLHLHQNAGQLFYSQKNKLFSLKTQHPNAGRNIQQRLV